MDKKARHRQLHNEFADDFSYLAGTGVGDLDFIEALQDSNKKDKLIQRLDNVLLNQDQIAKRPKTKEVINRIKTALINEHPVDLGGRRSRARRRKSRRLRRHSKRSRKC